MVIAALYVIKDGPYYGLEDVAPWSEDKDARTYKGPNKVVAHPPCERWGRYWGGGPMLHGTPRQKIKGDDNGCFAHALWAVRTFGGVLEHPEASHAWEWYGLTRPKMKGGWTDPDTYGGISCCVAQGNYGHRSQKLTWLYAVGTGAPDLKWGRTPGLTRIDEGFHSAKERKHYIERKPVKRTSKYDRTATPGEFRDLLINLAKG